MKILAIGDVTSPKGIEHLRRNLWRIRESHGVDFCIVNGENASFISGISPELAKTLLLSGADCITGGNHTMRNRAALSFLDECREILRPINFGDALAGRGYTVLDALGRKILVINAMGQVHIEPTLDSPIKFIEQVLDAEKGNYDIACLDIHAEATGEKLAIANYFDGRINVIFGTHTHVPTADMQILPEGTGYVTDLGMCGESGGILGMSAKSVIQRVLMHDSTSFALANGPQVADGVIFTLDNISYKCIGVERIRF